MISKPSRTKMGAIKGMAGLKAANPQGTKARYYDAPTWKSFNTQSHGKKENACS
jgi:hypothetical protein